MEFKTKLTVKGVVFARGYYFKMGTEFFDGGAVNEKEKDLQWKQRKRWEPV